jgi:protein tyrosine/serine phosphatase
MVAFFALAITCQAQEASGPKTFENIKIKNFGQMDDRFYRGAQPKEEDYKALAALGIRTIVDLRDDPKEYARTMTEAAGMKYVNIPMIAKKYPTEQATSLFLRVANDPETGKFFVHCAGGRHRTGAMGAAYRFENYHWNFDQVYNEMKQYDFYTSWGHGKFKDFVEDYYAKTQKLKTTAPSTTATETDASRNNEKQ